MRQALYGVLIAAALALVLTTSAIHADNLGYRYVTEDGVIHWTQSLTQVPAKYRAHAIRPSLNDASVFPKRERAQKLPARPWLPPPRPEDHDVYEPYLRQVQQRVTEVWLPKSRTGAQPTVTFQISRTGTVTNAHVQKSSGDTAYDALALETVLASAPFPPFPTNFPGSFLRVHVSFTAAR